MEMGKVSHVGQEKRRREMHTATGVVRTTAAATRMKRRESKRMTNRQCVRTGGRAAGAMQIMLGEAKIQIQRRMKMQRAPTQIENGGQGEGRASDSRSGDSRSGDRVLRYQWRPGKWHLL